MAKKFMVFFVILMVFFLPFLGGCIQKQEGLPIVVFGRDNASGTREFFWQQIMGKENFTENLREKNSNGGVYLSVTQTPGAIGYVSLSYVDNHVKVLTIDNITANKTNILNGNYPIARQLYLIIKGNATGAAKEFIEYLQSREGQAIVEGEGFIPLPTNYSYNASGKHLSGTLTIGGSTTVFPIVEKVRESFRQIYPTLEVTVSSTGSGPGITAVGEGIIDIGMSSRDLKQSESNLGLEKYTIAYDGIVIIINLQNTYTEGLTQSQIKAIYAGEITNWNEIK